MFWPHAKSDEHLVGQVLAGRREAFGTLVERYLPVVHAFAYARTGNHADAEDIAQDVFLTAFRSLDKLQAPAKFAPWVMGIARHTCSSYRRFHRREAEYVAGMARDEAVPPSDVERRELQRMLWERIRDLDESHREVLLLHYFGGKTSREIAQLLDISNDAVRKRLQRAREMLSERMLDELGAAPDDEASLKERVNRIMGVVVAMPVPWQTATVAASTTAGAAKLFGSLLSLKNALVVAGAMSIVAVGAYLAIQAGVPERPVLPTVEGSLVPPESDPPAVAEASATEAVTAAGPDSGNATAPVRAARRVPTPGDRGPGFIYGVVIRGDGAQVPHARVDLVRKLDDERDLFNIEAPPPHNVWKTTRADSQGRFSFANVPVAQYGLIAYADKGLLLRSISGVNMATYTRMDKPIVLELQPAMPLSGTVKDEAGRPVAGAAVYPYDYYEQMYHPFKPHWTNALAVVTDREGRFHLEGLYPPRWKLLVTSPHHAHVITEFVNVGEEDVEIVLPSGGGISGELVEAGTGRPLEGVQVAAAPRGGWFDVRTVRSDAQGRFGIGGLAAGEWQVTLDDRELVPRRPIPILVLGPGETKSGLRLEAEQGASVTGIAYSRATRRPLVGVQVSARLRPGSDSGPRQTGALATAIGLSQPTDAEGRFAITGLREGTYSIAVRDLGVIRPVLPASRGEEEPVSNAVETYVSWGETKTGIELLVGPSQQTVSIQGRVLDSQGRPVGGAAVYCEDAGLTGGLPRTLAIGFTDHQGHFALTRLYDAERVYVGARKGDELVSRRLGPVAAGADDLVIPLEPGATVAGKLLDASGRPLLAGSTKAVVSAMPLNPQDGPIPTVLTGLFGAYRLTGLASGTYDLYIEAQHDTQSFPPRTHVAQVKVTGGQTLEGFDLVYGKGDGVLSISGRVLARTGEGVAGVKVRAAGPVYRETMSTDDGGYTLNGLEPGEYLVYVRDTPYGGAGEEGVTAGHGDVDLVLSGTGEVTGVVYSGITGKPVTDFAIGHTTRGIRCLCRQTLDPVSHGEGRYHLKWVHAGEVAITVAAPGFAPVEQVVSLEDGAVLSDVDVYLGRGGEVRGRVTLAGQPVMGLQVFARSDLSSAVMDPATRTRTGEDGSYSLRSMPSGEATIEAFLRPPSGSVRVLSRRVLVETGKVSSADLDFVPADGYIEGRITVAGQQPTRATLSLAVTTPQGGIEYLHADANPDGSYTLDNVPVGLVEVTATAYGPSGEVRTATATANVASGTSIAQDFTL